MFPITFAATLVFLMTVCSQLSIGKASECKPIAEGNIDCSSPKITIDSKTFAKGTLDQRKRLSAVRKQVQWACGNNNGGLTWNKDANQIRVNFHDNGKVDWEVYKCDEAYQFSAFPTSAGKKCSVKSYIMSCPSGDGNSCVYESDKFSYSEKAIDVDAQVEGSKATDVIKHLLGKLQGAIKLGKVQKTTFKEKRYVVVPAGMSFCVNFDAESEKNENAPTGYGWKCYRPDFVKRPSTGKCTDLAKCPHPSICSGASVNLALSAFLMTLAYTTYLSII